MTSQDKVRREGSPREFGWGPGDGTLLYNRHKGSCVKKKSDFTN